jgi:uncharacterized membrane protein HdeD (DUF308 family)
MKIEIKTHNSKKSLLTAIVFLIVGALMLANPNQVVAIISYICGIVLITYGVYACIKNYYDTKEDSSTSSTFLMIGIITLVVGLLFIFLANVIGIALQYVFGAWILFSGINRLINALQVDKNDSNYIIQLVVAALLIIAGLYTILKSNLALSFVGLIMMIYAVLEIVGFVFNKNSDQNDETITVTKPEQKEKTKNVKDAKIIETKDKKKKKKKNEK